MIEDILGEELPLGEVDVLRELPQSELEYLVKHCPIVHLAKKESLAIGKYRRGVLFLLSGRVRVHEPTSGNQDLTFSVLEGGTVVGQLASNPRPSRVEALEASALSVVGLEDFEGLVLRNPGVGLNTIRLFSERLDVYERQLSDLIRKEVPARLAGLLLRLGEYEGSAVSGDCRIPVRYTHRQLASMVGSNREAVTRALGALKKAGAVRTGDRQIYITDAEALERLAGVMR